MSPVPPSNNCCTTGGGGGGGDFDVLFTLLDDLPLATTTDEEIATSASEESFPEITLANDGANWEQISPAVVNPHVIVRLANVFNVPQAVPTDILWDEEVSDHIGMHAAGTADLTVPTSAEGDVWGGIWEMQCRINLLNVTQGLEVTLYAMIDNTTLMTYESKIHDTVNNMTLSIPSTAMLLPEGASIKFFVFHDGVDPIDLYGAPGIDMISSASLVRISQSARITRTGS